MILFTHSINTFDHNSGYAISRYQSICVDDYHKVNLFLKYGSNMTRSSPTTIQLLIKSTVETILRGVGKISMGKVSKRQDKYICICRTSQSTCSFDSPGVDYIYIADLLLLPRIIFCYIFKMYRNQLARASFRSTSSINQIRNMITAQAVVYAQHGEPKDVLKTHKYEIDDDNLDSNSIIVKTLGSPVNPSDINQIQGVYPSKPEKTTELGSSEPVAVCGNEGLFEILKVGDNVSNFKVGDWCVPTSVNMGTWRTHMLCGGDEMTKIPNPEQSKANGKPSGLSVNQGATISVNPLTAYLMLTHYVKLTPGKDWFIQNGGNSAVGKYATQISNLLGINSISVIRDRPDLQYLIKNMTEECGATKVITEEQNASKEFGSEIKSWVKETGGEIKLALNCVGGKNSTGIARKLNNNGLMLTYGGMSMQPVILPTSLHIFKNITSSGFWVTQLLKNDVELKRKTLGQIIEWYENRQLKDAPSKETKFNPSDELSKYYIDGIVNSKGGKQLIVY